MSVKESATADRVLDVAQRLCQERGFNGFSFRDLSAALGITSASVHYHFPTKEDLGESLVKRYQERFGDTLKQIDRASGSASQQIASFADCLSALLNEGPKMCLCGMLASDRHTLPARVQTAVQHYFEFVEGWLAEKFAIGLKEGTVRGKREDSAILAHLTIAGLQGLLLCARVHDNPERFAEGVHHLLVSVGVDGETLEHR